MEMAAMIMALNPGDEVIMPSFTFVSTANAVLRSGGKPVFCEIDPVTLTMDVKDVERKITARTRALMPVHYAGVSAAMDEIMELARAKKLLVMEDAAQGFAAGYKGKMLGTIGDIGAFSFHDTKNVVSGEGGAFVTDSEELSRKAEIAREKGTNRSNFLRGEVDKYTWVSEGSSFILPELLAALLEFQIDIIDEIQSNRRRLYLRYLELLGDLAKKERIVLPVIPSYCQSNYHIFHILLESEQRRNSVMKSMKERGVGATFHYIPLHSAPYALKELGTGEVRLPITDRVSATLLRLPLYPGLSESDQDYVVESLHEALA
jgi:dTDP-4-amino-4,6-dideoxygalactose transaminase